MRRVRPQMIVIAWVFAWTSATGCGADGASIAPVDSIQRVDLAPGASARCVWNAAYQENYAADSVAEILASARDCYVLIDPFDSAPARDAIRAMIDRGNTVGCYISVGTCEDARDDFAAMRPFCVERQWGEWEGEYFVDRTDTGLLPLMKSRIDQLSAWGCEMVEFDNMDWAFDDDYRRTYGFSATAAEAIAYNRSLCEHVHSLGMSCMAKSTRQGAEIFDGGTFESYPDDLNWWESDDLSAFLDAGQLGVIVHYGESDCEGRYAWYRERYGDDLSFICEHRGNRAYVHFERE